MPLLQSWCFSQALDLLQEAHQDQLEPNAPQQQTLVSDRLTTGPLGVADVPKIPQLAVTLGVQGTVRRLI